MSKSRFIIQTFFIYFIQSAVLRRKKNSSGQGRSESKKKYFFLGSGPKIRSVGTWETDNQLDVPIALIPKLFDGELWASI